MNDSQRIIELLEKIESHLRPKPPVLKVDSYPASNFFRSQEERLKECDSHIDEANYRIDSLEARDDER